MSVAELKLQIINKVSSINDEMILEEIYRLISLESGIDSIYKLSEEEKTAIESGLKDIKAGDVYSSDQADKMIREWLKK